MGGPLKSQEGAGAKKNTSHRYNNYQIVSDGRGLNGFKVFVNPAPKLLPCILFRYKFLSYPEFHYDHLRMIKSKP